MKFIKFYTDSFRGLSSEIWMLSLATLINRAGTMVIPFLSIYMMEDLGFSLSQIGWVMTFFGLGSLSGSWIGGKLSDGKGFYATMVVTMFLTGLGFFFLIYFQTFISMCAAIFVQMTIADSFRPAAYTAMDAYSKPGNKTRSIALVRLFINLGYSIGPAIGGLIFYKYGAELLFYLDGATCIASALFIMLILKPKTVPSDEEKALKNQERKGSLSVWRDRKYLLMLFILFIFNIAFFQLFANLPLYYKEVHLLNEKTIGWIMALNGIVIFMTEMPLVSYLEKIRANALKIIFTACILLGISYLFLNLTMWFGILVISMSLLTISEMLAFPFSNSWSLEQAPKARVGEYMGAYTIAFSLSHIIGPNLGMQVSAQFGFEASWYLMVLLAFIAATLTYILINFNRN